MDNRFPPGQMSQVNQFNDLVPHDWERIFVGSVGTIPYAPRLPITVITPDPQKYIFTQAFIVVTPMALSPARTRALYLRRSVVTRTARGGAISIWLTWSSPFLSSILPQLSW